MENDGSIQTATESVVGLLQQTQGGLTSLSSDEKTEAKVVQKTENDQAIAEEDNQPLQTPTESVSAEDLPTEDETVDNQAVDETTEEPQLTPQEQLFEVKVQGDTYQVDRNELIDGYQRQQDYTRKTESLAIEKQQYKEDVQKLNENWKSKLDQAEKLTGLARQQLGLEAQGLDELMMSDPIEATRKKHELEVRARQLSEQQRQISLATQEERGKFLKEEERKVRLEIPEMADPEKRPEFVQGMRNYLEKMGFKDQEINNVNDSRYFKLIRDGMKWNTLQKNKNHNTKKVASAPKVVKGGVVSSKGARDQRSRDDKMTKLKKSGSIEDATELLKDLFK